MNLNLLSLEYPYLNYFDMSQLEENKNYYEQLDYPSYSKEVSKTQSQFIAKVYTWMFVALCITAAISTYVGNSDVMMNYLINNKMIFIGIFLAQIFSVGYISLRIERMSYTTMVVLFLLYAALTGISLSSIFLIYTSASLATVFGITAATFGVMSIVGYTTKTDLTSFGKIMMMGLIGIIIGSVVNLFLGSSMMYYIITYVGVAVFVGLIAYDTQMIKSYAMLETQEMRKKAAIMGALSLYLDFINLFVLLLRLFGRRD